MVSGILLHSLFTAHIAERPLNGSARPIHHVAGDFDGGARLLPHLDLAVGLRGLVQDTSDCGEIPARARFKGLEPPVHDLLYGYTLVGVMVHEVALQAVALGAPLVLLYLAGRADGSLLAGLVLFFEGVAEGGGQGDERLGAPGGRLGVAGP